MKIYPQKGQTLTKGELLELAGLLVKAGYSVRLGKAKVGEKWIAAVEFTVEGAENVPGSQNLS